MVGRTYDNTLTGLGTSNNPFIVLTSLTIPDMSYWAKVLSLKFNSAFGGVQFSNDGALLIAHSSYTTIEYIVVFKSETGAVLSARSYSTSTNTNYNIIVKSVLISSGVSQMAYVLTNYGSSSCNG